MSKTTFIAAGDAFITRRLPEGGYPGFGELQALVCSHDVSFLNLESTYERPAPMDPAAPHGVFES